MPSSSSTKTVRFDCSLTITEFPMILGDNPACSAGAPVQIGWNAICSTSRNLELFEHLRKDERRSRNKLVLSVQRRTGILLHAGYGIDQIASATMQVELTQQLRAKTLSKHGWDRFRFTHILETTGKLPKGIMKGVLGTGGLVKSAMSKTGRRVSHTFSSSASAAGAGPMVKPKSVAGRTA
jgi:hypothetical protein